MNLNIFINPNHYPKLRSIFKKILPQKVKKILKRFYTIEFISSNDYWEKRYASGGNSGAGSYNRLAEFKASIINDFIISNNIENVIEFGCGDGNQLKLMNYKQYTGVDVSKTSIKICKKKFSDDNTKVFWLDKQIQVSEFEKKFDLSISLDVIYHLIEDDVFEKYINNLFYTSAKYVCIYASNYNFEQCAHVKHRKFTDFIEERFTNWELISFIKNKFPFDENDTKNTSFADFYFYAVND